VSKFGKPHVEVRIYVPLEGEEWQEFQNTPLYAQLVQSGLWHLHRTGRKKPGRSDGRQDKPAAQAQ
jgi:hypothetical protein